MASGKLSKVQLRLFVPMVLLIWITIGVMVMYQNYHEREYRTNSIHDQLKSITERIINAYENKISAHNYLNFLRQFYDKSIFNDLNVTVYDKNQDLIYNIGAVVPSDIMDHKGVKLDLSRTGNTGTVSMIRRGKPVMFYIVRESSHNDEIQVITAMPIEDIDEAAGFDSDIWIVGVILTLITTVVTFYSTRHLTRNILLLRDFAVRASNGERFQDIDQFSNDEVGEISRRIIMLYRDKAKAVTRSDREHKIALHVVEEKARVRRQLVNNINHELKTPIGVIRGYIDTILQDPDMSPEMRVHFLERAQTNVERLCSLMNDVSTMTRLDENTGNISFDEVDFHDLVYTIHSDIEATNFAPGMAFEFDVPLGCKVRANESLLNGVIMNLVRNAVLHSHGTEMGLDLIAESTRFYTFSFYDNGCGVANEHIPHLFERFYRVDLGRSRKVGGTGLGLPIVKSTIMSFGGTISVHNRSTGGLEFVFTLPKWLDNAPKASDAPSQGVDVNPMEEKDTKENVNA